MPSPWEQSPQEAWAENFRSEISRVTSEIQDGGVEDYKSGVEAAFNQAGVDLTAEDASKAVRKFSDSVDKFSDEAMKRTTVLAAAQYLENNSVDVDAGTVAGSLTYEETSADQFEAATRVLGEKFVSEWANSYTA